MEIKIRALVFIEARLGNMTKVCGHWADLNLRDLLTHFGHSPGKVDGTEQRESGLPVRR